MSHRPPRTVQGAGLTLACVAAAVLTMMLLPVHAVGQPADPLGKAFVQPPTSMAPRTWWHWMNGNITSVGITKDLEAMHQVGVAGAQMFDVTDGIPAGPVKYMSDEWRGMVKHAVQEADRLGLELCIHNCAGWSSSGGPWIKPEQAMQMVVVSEVRVKGPARFEQQLPQPPTKLGFYRDIAILAFPTPPVEAEAAASQAPQVTASVPGFDGSKLLDGNPDTYASLSLRGPGEPQYIQFEYEQPRTVRSLSILPSWSRGGTRGELQASADGETFRTVTTFGVPQPDIVRAPMTVSFDPASARFFRLAFPAGSRRPGVVALAEVGLEAGFRISNIAGKAGFVRADHPAPDTREVPPDAIIGRADIRDLTAQMDADGRLAWDAPAGDWTILRIGYTPTGKDNHPAPEEGRGLECDKLSREAVDAHWDGMLGKVIGDIGPLAGKTLKYTLIDSYEVGCQNWTPRFREEFRSRRGYDPLPYLPAMTGRVVDSLEVSERFLWDVRRTIGDLFADNYWGHFAELCHQHGMQLATEPYGNGGFDDLACGGRADLPMGEFWAGGGNDNQLSKLASSIAHTTGRKIAGAESFTAGPEQGGWRNHPYKLKPLGDLIYTGGINRFIFHRYAHQPWLNLVPGMTMGPHGFHFERTVTWWDVSPAWLQYLSRSQYLLQEGLFVGDLCYFEGEGAPNTLPARQYLNPPPPPGYDYDGCCADVILTRMSVKDGRIVLPDGMSYRMLVLPPRQTMSPEMLRKIRDLVRAGATVIGPKPLRSPSLQGYPDCDREVQALADEVWGPVDGKTVTEHTYGEGVVIWGKPLDEVLAARGVPPDFECSSARGKPDVRYIHRSTGDADIYFVSSGSSRPEAVECTFRVGGKVPELWHPDDGTVEDAPVYTREGGRTTVPVRFGPAGSVFVVFRKPVGSADQLVSIRANGRSVFDWRPSHLPKLAVVKAVYGVLITEEPEVTDVTKQLARLVQNGQLTVTASNAIAGDPALNVPKQLRVDYVLNGEPGTVTVDEGATLRIPPQPAPEGQAGTLEIRKALYGILPVQTAGPTETQTVDVTTKLADMIQGDMLTVVASNALAGDPAPLIVKQMRVDYTLDGKPYTTTVNENQTLELPLGTEETGTFEQTPPPEVTVAADGQATVMAWEPGAFEATTASGKTLRAQVRDAAKPVEIPGPWEVRFPPNLGAPARATFDKLISWPDSDDTGIKYFSGTATYVKDLTVPADLLGRGKILVLDLGVVREIAQVRLNGRDLGILWKPPFRVDITRAARAGANHLEVRITNLWPNRLIGDEQLPDDCEWTSGGAVKAWPAWLAEGKPRPPTGRITFTTWKHYTKDSPLLESGLLGAVTLRSARTVPLLPP